MIPSGHLFVDRQTGMSVLLTVRRLQTCIPPFSLVRHFLSSAPRWPAIRPLLRLPQFQILHLDAPLASAKGEQTAVLAGGCFWGVEAVFEHVKGVIDVKSGYSGGAADAADYRKVSTGQTGHAESVQITYDPSQISYGQLLKVFFSVAHDPTELNRQGPDRGTQYRSAIFLFQRRAKAYCRGLHRSIEQS